MTTDSFTDAPTFMKMHGLGNDFVVIDSRGRVAVVTEKLARALGDRNRGVGFDQLAEIRDGVTSDVILDFWNSDGSRAGACGNATRCVSEFLMRQAGTGELSLTTERGLLRAKWSGDLVSINMGLPQLDWQDVPLARDVPVDHLPIDGDPVAVGMGNPHCVFFVDDIADVDPAVAGPRIENHELFPERCNVEFAQVRSRDEIRMRVWERGTGITLACGSGACATAVAAHLRGLTDKCVRMEVDGGWLTLDWRDDGVWMTGPTAHVFDARLTSAFMESIK